MTIATITKNGKRFALVPWADYRRMAQGADMPPLPPVAADGTGNAIDFARASIARTIIRQRRAAGLSQEQLARIAGVRQETISRIESGKHTATVRIIDKIDRALRATNRNGNGVQRRRR